MTTDFTKPEPRVSFLGVPVFGSFNEPATRVEQYPVEQFQPILQAVLQHPDFAAVRWTQYTPYFDDGDPCVFSVREYSIGFLLNSDEEGTDGFDSYTHRIDRHPSLGSVSHVWDEDTRKYVEQPYEGPDEQRYLTFKALSDALSAGHFENVLLAAFGDHAEVTITPDRIDVDHYHHD